ncbi:hypothetical protein EGW08_013287, partial [Elysia chlorotica]
MSSFSERAVNLTRTSLMVGFATSLSWEVGIFHALAEASTPLTSVQVAQAKRLKERYVRELLGSLVTAELVQVSTREDGVLLYSLEESAKKELEGPTGPILSYPAVVATLYQPVKECVYEDGPNGYGLAHNVAYIVPWLNIKKPIQRNTPVIFIIRSMKIIFTEAGIDVAEMGGGKARLSATFASQFPKSRFVASEICPELVESNRTQWAHVPNLSFSVDDLCAVPETPDKQFDFVFCNDVIHDLPDPLSALRGIRRFLRKPDGLFMFMDKATSGSVEADRGDMAVSFYYAAS